MLSTYIEYVLCASVGILRGVTLIRWYLHPREVESFPWEKIPAISFSLTQLFSSPSISPKPEKIQSILPLVVGLNNLIIMITLNRIERKKFGDAQMKKRDVRDLNAINLIEFSWMMFQLVLKILFWRGWETKWSRFARETEAVCKGKKLELDALHVFCGSWSCFA